jgi:hypothetical protein
VIKDHTFRHNPESNKLNAVHDPSGGYSLIGILSLNKAMPFRIHVLAGDSNSFRHCLHSLYQNLRSFPTFGNMLNFFPQKLAQ